MTSSLPKVVVTHWVHPEILDFLGQHCEVVANPTRASWTKAEILRQAEDADGLMVFMPDSIDQDFLEACPKLKVIAGALRGYDNFDIAACRERKVWFTIVPDLLAAPTAELTVGLLLNLARCLPDGDAVIRSGKFAGWRPILFSQGLANKTIGILGMGKLGQALVPRLEGFEAKLQYCDPQVPPTQLSPQWNIRAVNFETLIQTSDYLVLMVPLQLETYHLIDHAVIARMKTGCVLINPCRGSVVDEVDVADALECRQLSGYAADVYEMEDWAISSRPMHIEPRLLEMRNRTFFTPHLGSAVESVRFDIAMEAAENLVQALHGKIPQGYIFKLTN